MSVHRFGFRTRWLGYDRTEVNRLLDQVAGDRQFLKDKLTYLESVVARQNGAEGEPPHGGAPERAAVEAQRLQLDRLKDMTRDMATCLESCVSILRKAHDLLASEASPTVASPLFSRGVVPAATERHPDVAERPLEHTEGSDEVGGLGFAPEPASATPWARRLAYVGLAMLAVGGGVVVTAVTRGPASAPQGPPTTASQTVSPAVPVIPSRATTPDPVVPAAKVPETGSMPAPQAGPPAGSQGLSVLLTARGACWIRSIVDGSHVVERLLQPGETILVWGREEVLLRAGDGAALTMTINGQAAVPLGRAGQVVTRRITRENLKVLLQQPA